MLVEGQELQFLPGDRDRARPRVADVTRNGGDCQYYVWLFSMARGQTGDDHVANLVDRFLRTEKHPQGRPLWREGNPGDMRIRWPLLVGTSVSEAFLNLVTYPNSPELRFTIGLNFRHQIARIDFVPEYDWHANPPDQVWRLGSAQIHGPHYHAWADNRYLATASALPRELACARPLPAQIRRWEQAFRWFCGEVGILLDEEQIIEPPPRSSLL